MMMATVIPKSHEFFCWMMKRFAAISIDYQREKKLSTANGGSDAKLSDKEAYELIDHLQEITYLYVKDICQYVWQIYGVKYSISGMTKWLHAFWYKKPHAVPAKADKIQQEKFIKHYDWLKKK